MHSYARLFPVNKLIRYKYTQVDTSLQQCNKIPSPSSPNDINAKLQLLRINLPAGVSSEIFTLSSNFANSSFFPLQYFAVDRGPGDKR